MNAPLYEQLKKYAKEKNRFHMPAHNGQIIDFSDFENLENETYLYGSAPFDITELSFSDNLNCPNGVIEQAEKLMAEAYGVENSLFFTAGATSAIFTAIGAIRTKTNKIAVDLFAHKAVFSACRFFGFEVTIIQREFDNEGFPLPISSDKILQTLTHNFILNKTKKLSRSQNNIKKCKNNFIDQNCKDNIGAVVITSPDYFGNCLELEKIAKTVHSQNALLMVDEAHGSHFVFSNLLPTSANKFADLFVNSLHKTMPVFTGGAILNINCDLTTQCRLKRANLHTSSPSYVTMCSLDYARALFEAKGENKYFELKKEIEKLKSQNQNYKFKDAESPLHDFSRLVINVDAIELEKQKIYAEMSWGKWSVFICTPFNMDKLNYLSKALKNLNPVEDKVSNTKQNLQYSKLNSLSFPDKLLPLDFDLKTEFIPLENSLGRISAQDIGCYPPGTPILFYGETVTKDKLNFLLEHKNSIFNLVSNKICVIITKVASANDKSNLREL